MQNISALAAILICLLCLNHEVAAADNYVLAYYLKIDLGEEPFVLQERGIRFGVNNPHVIPMGRGGRGRCILRLNSVGMDSGELLVEIYGDDKSEVTAANPIYSFDIDFGFGIPGEFRSKQSGLDVEFAYNIVRP